MALLGALPADRLAAVERGDVVVAAGFAGSGFKHVPLVGRLVRELVCDGAATADATSTTLFDFTFTNPTPTSDDAYHRATLPAIHRIRRRAGF